MIRSPFVAYAGPFLAFFSLLALSKIVPLPPLAVQAGFVAIMAVVIALVAGPADLHPDIDFRVRNWSGTVFIGVAVFVIWIAPDRLFPGYRHFWLFENPVMGKAQTSLSTEHGSRPRSYGCAPFGPWRSFRGGGVVLARMVDALGDLPRL